MRRKPGSLLPLEVSVLNAGTLLQAGGTAEFHGYELAKELRDLEGARRLLGHGTLYKVLGRLEAAGLVESRWEEPEAAHSEHRPRRRLYRLTASGSAALARAAREEAAASRRLVASRVES